jgi:hypothetical protein
MTAFLDFHAFAAARGDGLHPKLRQLFERAATSPVFDVAIRPDGLLQSGPDPVSETARDRVNVSANLSPARDLARADDSPRGPTKPQLMQPERPGSIVGVGHGPATLGGER